MRECAIYDRADRPLVERETVKKDNSTWVVLAAGIDAHTASEFFPVSGNRGKFATLPVHVAGGGEISLLLVMRFFDPAKEPIRCDHHVTVYAPGSDIPFIAIRQAHIRATHLPDNEIGLNSIRWELQPSHAVQDPLEKWLANLHKVIGYNPAHAPSHLHFNSKPKALGRVGEAEGSQRDLRLAMGSPNPLAMIASLAVWLQQL